jgi:hypothetical protein
MAVCTKRLSRHSNPRRLRKLTIRKSLTDLMTLRSRRSRRRLSNLRELRSLRRRPKSRTSLKSLRKRKGLINRGRRKPIRLRRPRSQRNPRRPRSLRLRLLQPSLHPHHLLCCRRGRSSCLNRPCHRTRCLSNSHRRRYSRSLRHRKIPAKRPGPVPMHNQRIHRPRPLRRLTLRRLRGWQRVRVILRLRDRQHLPHSPRLSPWHHRRRPNPNNKKISYFSSTCLGNRVLATALHAMLR